MCSVHGDDFTTAGPKEALDWFKKELEAKYELKEEELEAKCELKEGSRLGPAECAVDRSKGDLWFVYGASLVGIAQRCEITKGLLDCGGELCAVKHMRV